MGSKLEEKVGYITEFPEFAKRMPGYVPYNPPNALYGFEREFDDRAWHGYVTENWGLTVWVSAVYVILVFAGKGYMAGRERYDLRMPLAVWSGSLAVFSILGMTRMLPEFLHNLARYGFQESVCNPVYTYLSSGTAPFWQSLFLLSKLVELGDTAFIVLRKQPLIFLHWYHHVTVMIFSWYSFTEWTAVARWFCIMNYCVHSVMYSYYCLRALRVPVPKVISKVITSLQILQMVGGLWMGGAAYWYKYSGYQCQVSLLVTFLSTTMYLSYFFLFSRFFYNSYLKPRPKVHEGAINNNMTNGHTNGVNNGKIKSN